jgi:DNA-binding response OmpR family regulator
MEKLRREQIQKSLASLAQSYAATMEIMEQTLELLCTELSLDPLSYLKGHSFSPADLSRRQLKIDPALLSVTFDGKTCFLGNTYPFKLLSRLAQRPNTYVPHHDLLSDVWRGTRSEEAVRSVVKTLRIKLRDAGLHDLADAIDGRSPGHYALKLDR